MGKKKPGSVNVRIDARNELARKMEFLKKVLGSSTYKGMVETIIIMKYDEEKKKEKEEGSTHNPGSKANNPSSKANNPNLCPHKIVSFRIAQKTVGQIVVDNVADKEMLVAIINHPEVTHILKKNGVVIEGKEHLQ